jgi:tetratricopeptide (TPR) repeat protein
VIPIHFERQMISKACWVLPVVWLACCEVGAFAQKQVPQKSVTVTVVDAHVDPALPVAAVTVSLSYLDGSTGVIDARDVTNPRGQAFLHVSPETEQRDDLRIEIRENSKLVIYEPPDGQLHGLGSAVPVKLLPQGSAALAGPAQIEAVQRRLSSQVSSLQRQSARQQNEIQGLQGQLAAQADSQKQVVNEGLAEWAKADGLDVHVAQQKVLEWARGIQVEPGVSAERRALAAFALKNYGEAADLFGEATDDEMESLDKLKKQQQEQNRVALQKILETTQQRANALQLVGRYHDATAVLKKTRDYISVQQKASPEDGGLRNLWLDSMNVTAIARAAEGSVSSADLSAQLLAQSVSDFQIIDREYAATGNRQGIAMTQLGLGDVLCDEGERLGGIEAANVLERAVQAYRDALNIYTKADFRMHWAAAEVGLGNALLKEGERGSDDKAALLLEQAVQAYGSALEVRTKADFPQEWASTEMNLGDALVRQGERAGDDKAAALFEQAVQAYRNALEVRTKAELREDWAQAQVNLGVALWDEGNRVDGEQASVFLEQSVRSYRSALEVYTEAALPQDWARTQMNLGIALKDEGDRASGEQAAGLFDQAVLAYRSALRVRTKMALPQQWALTQINLGSALLDKGKLGGDETARLMDQSTQAYLSALDVFTKADFPRYYAVIMRNLALAYDEQGNVYAAREARAAAQAVDPQ